MYSAKILVLGDSIMWLLFYKPADTMPEQLHTKNVCYCLCVGFPRITADTRKALKDQAYLKKIISYLKYNNR